jgi:hypothetical protein
MKLSWLPRTRFPGLHSLSGRYGESGYNAGSPCGRDCFPCRARAKVDVHRDARPRRSFFHPFPSAGHPSFSSGRRGLLLMRLMMTTPTPDPNNPRPTPANPNPGPARPPMPPEKPNPDVPPGVPPPASDPLPSPDKEPIQIPPETPPEVPPQPEYPAPSAVRFSVLAATVLNC